MKIEKNRECEHTSIAGKQDEVHACEQKITSKQDKNEGEKSYVR